jgi:hypothetical protein
VKFIIIAICVLFLIFLGISLVLPAKIKVERSISIRAKPKAVKYQILNFRNWPNWHPYLQTGEKIKISLSRNEKKMELTDNKGKKLAYQFVSELNDTIVFSHSDRKNHFTGYKFIVSRDPKNGTFLVLAVEADFGHDRWKRLEGILVDKVTGPHYELALQNLKHYIEGDTSAIRKGL